MLKYAYMEVGYFNSLLIFSCWLALKRHLEYVSLERFCHKSCLDSLTLYRALLQQFYQQDPSDSSFENHVTCQGLTEMFKKKKCFTVFSTFLHLSLVSFKVRGTLNVSYLSCSRTGLVFLSMLIPMMHIDTNQRAFTNGQDTWKRTLCTYFPLKATSHLEYCSASLPHFLSLSSHTLSIIAWVNLSPRLAYLLSQSRKSRDYQRNNPRTRGLLLPASTWKPTILPSPCSFHAILFPFLGRGWGSNDGR